MLATWIFLDDDDGAQGIELRESNYGPQHTKYAPSISDSGYSETDTKTKSEKSTFSEVRANITLK